MENNDKGKSTFLFASCVIELNSKALHYLRCFKTSQLQPAIFPSLQQQKSCTCGGRMCLGSNKHTRSTWKKSFETHLPGFRLALTINTTTTTTMVTDISLAFDSILVVPLWSIDSTSLQGGIFQRCCYNSSRLTKVFEWRFVSLRVNVNQQ